MRPIKTFFRHPRLILSKLLRILSPLIKDDKLYLRLLFRFEMGYWMDFDNPQTFTEKIQWLKLYNRRPEYTQMVDKYAVKEYVANIIGDEYIIPTIGVWDSVDDIDFDKLPNQFVLKTTHGGGSSGVFVCRDKSKINIQDIQQCFVKAFEQDIYTTLREWPYKGVPKKILCECFLSEVSNNDLVDYKFYCFRGSVKYCQVIKDRNTDEKIYFFNQYWEYQQFSGLYTEPNIDLAPPISLPMPENYSLMLNIAETLSKDIPFCRVDLYNVMGKVYFGEITFFPASGFGFFAPKEWDNKMGDLLSLNSYPSVAK
ncbi:MAG: hypothetical protein IIW52_04650 [Alistipes sp.]|nr:hypothetical protein [Alistipes sp.]